MEQGDEEALSIWEWFKDISMVEYKRIYKMLNMDLIIIQEKVSIVIRQQQL